MPKAKRRLLFPALVVAGIAPAAYAQLSPVPVQPIIGAGVYNAGVSDASIGTANVLVAGNSSAIAANNTTVLNDFITYASSQGGGTVIIPTGTYDTNEILLKNNVDLDVQTGATLQNFTTTNTLIANAANCTGNVAITGGGTLNNNASGGSNNKMVQLDGLTNVLVNDVTIENAPNEHLVSECCNNVTFNNITIQDATLRANTDGIDFSGTNYLIENSSMSDDDDDVVAKPNTDVFNGITAYTANVLVQNITITNGHGVSIGGQTNAGLNGMYVNNVNENATGNTALEEGIHLKAGDGTTSNTENGGLVENVTFNNFTMTNVDVPISIDSFYQNGNNFPGDPPYGPNPTDSTEPIWKNITYDNITVNSATGSASLVYGLNSSPPNTVGLNFENINMVTTKSEWKMFYATSVFMNNVDIVGAELPDFAETVKGNTDSDEDVETDDTFAPSANPTYAFVGFPTLNVPEPGSITLFVAAGMLNLRRRPRRRDT